MDAQELYEEWMSGESSGMRPRRIQRLRDDLRRHTDLYIPRRLPEIENWLDTMKGQVTKSLRETAETDESEGEA